VTARGHQKTTSRARATLPTSHGRRRSDVLGRSTAEDALAVLERYGYTFDCIVVLVSVLAVARTAFNLIREGVAANPAQGLLRSSDLYRQDRSRDGRKDQNSGRVVDRHRGAEIARPASCKDSVRCSCIAIDRALTSAAPELRAARDGRYTW